MRRIQFLFIFFVFSHFGLTQAQKDCDDLEAGVMVSGYNRNLSFYGVINDSLRLCQSVRVDLNISWLVPVDMFYGIHEVGEFQGVRGGAVGRFDVTDFGYQRLEWVSVGAGKISSLIHCGNISLL